MVDAEMLDPETGTLAGAEGAELICATDSPADNPTKTKTANNAVENDLILFLHPRQTQIETES